MKTNFTAKTAKVIRNKANEEHKGFNACVRTIKSVWKNEAKDAELATAIKLAKADGIGVDQFTPEFIRENLAGTKWVDGASIMVNKKGQMVTKTTWTAGQLIDYVRRANKARLEKANK